MITMASVRQAFEAMLLGFTAGGDVVVEASPLYTPQPGKPYLSGRLSAFENLPLGVGVPTAQSALGTYQVNVNRPAAEGADPGSGIAAQIAFLFGRGTALALATGPVLTVEQASEQPIIASGSWLTIPVVVRWYGTE